MEEYYKDRHEAKMRWYRIIGLMVTILVTVIVSIVVGWRVVAAIGLLLFFISGFVFGVVFLIPKMSNNYLQILTSSIYVGFLGALSTFLLLQLDLDPKITNFNSQLIASGKAGLILFIPILVLGLLVVRFPRVFSVVSAISKRFRDNLHRVIIGKA
jgi:hypothetical protein